MLGICLELIQLSERIGEAESRFSDGGQLLIGSHVQAFEDRRQVFRGRALLPSKMTRPATAPRLVFANRMALIGPRPDPAGVTASGRSAQTLDRELDLSAPLIYLGLSHIIIYRSEKHTFAAAVR
ncbi:MAG: hypothetical protein RQ826_17680 [Xanthomonadales bacterium]|nr:hypothetical protein [Xanthomonadales bacterium]